MNLKNKGKHSRSDLSKIKDDAATELHDELKNMLTGSPVEDSCTIDSLIVEHGATPQSILQFWSENAADEDRASFLAALGADDTNTDNLFDYLEANDLSYDQCLESLKGHLSPMDQALLCDGYLLK